MHREPSSGFVFLRRVIRGLLSLTSIRLGICTARPGLAVLLATCLLVVSCGSKSNPAGPRRLALLPFDNLSGDASLSWLTVGIPGVLSTQLRGNEGLAVLDAADIRTAQYFKPTEELSGWFEKRGGELWIHAVVRNPASQKTLRTFESKASTQDPLPAMESIAKELAPNTRPFPTRNRAALEAYFSAASETDPQRQQQLLEQAATADPSFANAFLARAQRMLATGDREGAAKALVDARRNSAQFTEGDRARLEFLNSQVTGDARSRLAALTKLTKLEPGNVEQWQGLAQSALLLRDFKTALNAYEQVVKLDPSTPGNWNLLAYARTYTGDLAGGVQAIEQYRKLSPNDPNVLDSLAEIHFYSGKFAEAAKIFLEVHAKQPAMLQGGHLFRAALAQRLTGNAAEADRTFGQYIDFRRKLNDPLTGQRHAMWLYMTGRKTEARKMPEAGSMSCLWALDSGDREAALPMLRAGTRDNLLGLCALFAQNAKGEEAWQAILGKGVPEGALRNELLAFALTIQGDYRAAKARWKELDEVRPPESDSESRIMVAWTEWKSGGSVDVPRVVPPQSLDPGLLSLVWSKYFELRAASGGE
jgi:cytochrome c-type biogenesis protein CcmH/NrfG